MAWQDELIPTLRGMILDDEDTQRFTDARLENLSVVAARLVVQELEFVNNYTVSVANGSISPDPTSAATLDNDFINLVAAKAACIIDHGSAIKAADQALRVKDGQSEVDLRDTFKAKLDIIKNGWCANYETIKSEYVTGQQGNGVGAMIVGPFRMFSGVGARTYYTGGDPRYSP